MRIRFVCSSLALLVAWQGHALAGEPTPSSCTVSSIAVCPAGDLAIRVVVRRAKVPMPGSVVTLDLSGCTAMRMGVAPKDPGYAIVDGWRLVRRADEEGLSEFRIRAGGACACMRIPVLADGIVIAERVALTSPDQNGDLAVDEADLTIVRQKFGTKDLTADFNGDGRVSPPDLVLARQHLGHHADFATPTRVTTWGEIKAGYR